MQGTNVFVGETDLKDHGNTRESKQGWVTARPIGRFGFFYKLKCAWLVLQNKADIVIWWKD